MPPPQSSGGEQVCILGLGYVGLTLAVVMAERGYRVVGVEINPETLRVLQSGTAHFYEVGLTLRLGRQLRLGNLRVTGSVQDAATCTTFLITVGTPLNAEGVPRLDMVERVTRDIASVMNDDSIVILRSTVKIGTTRKVVVPILEATGKRFQVAYCPERTIEGRALEELVRLPQIVGGGDPDASWRAMQLFQRITPTTIRVSTLETAELIKLLDNSYRDLFFSFGNEVAMLCDAVGLDAAEVINAANTGYERTSIAKPGLVGGPCLEKDPHILAASLSDVNFHPRLIATGRALNESLPEKIVEAINAQVAKDEWPKQIRIAICGIAFKGRPETDDTRGTPTKYVIDALREQFPEATFVGQDFAVKPEAISAFGLTPVTIEAAFEGSHLVVVTNNNSKYEWLDIDKEVEKMARPGVVFDCWGVLPASFADMPANIRFLRLGCSSQTAAAKLRKHVYA